MHGVLGVECSNHSVPTIFFNDLAQFEKVGLFHAWKITPTFTPTDILDLDSGGFTPLFALSRAALGTHPVIFLFILGSHSVEACCSFVPSI